MIVRKHVFFTNYLYNGKKADISIFLPNLLFLYCIDLFHIITVCKWHQTRKLSVEIVTLKILIMKLIRRQSILNNTEWNTYLNKKMKIDWYLKSFNFTAIKRIILHNTYQKQNCFIFAPCSIISHRKWAIIFNLHALE